MAVGLFHGARGTSFQSLSPSGSPPHHWDLSFVVTPLQGEVAGVEESDFME